MKIIIRQAMRQDVRVCLNNQIFGLVLGLTGLFEGERINSGRMS